MPHCVYNKTQEKWIYCQTECDKNDVLCYSECDESTPIFRRGYIKANGTKVDGHWAHSKKSQIVSTGKYGTKTPLHIEGNLEIFCKWNGNPIILILPEELTCPASRYCPDSAQERCIIHTRNQRINLRTIYSESDYEPHKNIIGDFAYDMLLYDQGRTRQAGLEIYKSSEVSLRKSLEGWPIIELKCDSKRRLDWLRSLTYIDLSGKHNESNENILHYNLALLPCFVANLPCRLEDILRILHDELKKLPKEVSQPHNLTNSQEINPGLQPWDKWPIGPAKRKDRLLEEIIRDPNGGRDFICSWIRQREGMPLLSQRSRERYGIEANQAELDLDKRIYDYLQNKVGK